MTAVASAAGRDKLSGATPRPRLVRHLSVNLYARGTEVARKAAADRVGIVFAEALESTKNVVPFRPDAVRRGAGVGLARSRGVQHAV